MTSRITILEEGDLEKVDDLGRRYRKTLGFLTRETLHEYLRRQRVLGAWTSSGELVGYLLFADYPDRFRIAQLCVDGASRGQGLARQMLEGLKALASGQKVIKLRCRRDFAAHHMWPKLGFIPLKEKAGRSSAGHPLTLWCYRLDEDDELGLWRAEQSDEVLDVVIDAQIFYDFDEPETPKSLISKGLQNDFLVDSLKLWITDELFVEIDRHGSGDQRKRSMELAHGLARIHCDRNLEEQFRARLRIILPHGKPSQDSDINHLAKTAASDLRVFVTRDEGILKKAVEIKAVTALTIMDPTELITSIHEETERQSYSPSRVSGFGLLWRRFTSADCANLPDEAFRNEVETKGVFLEKLRSYLARPTEFTCEHLLSQGASVAIRILDRSEPRALKVPFSRVEHSSDLELFGQFLIADTLSSSVGEGCARVEFQKTNISPHLEPMLLGMGFTESNGNFVRFTLAEVATRLKAIEIVEDLAPDVAIRYRELSDLSLEQNCAPLFSQSETPCFLIPIQPAFAMGLIDRGQSADDLFGGDPSILLRWQNVYYRKASRHKMLRAPGRILWYVSGHIGEIVAISHLDEVEIDVPKALFRKHQKFGILEWKDLYEFCGRDITKEIMALKFSRTFMFRHRISLQEFRKILHEDELGESLQSPSLLPLNTMTKLFRLGYPNPS